MMQSARSNDTFSSRTKLMGAAAGIVIAGCAVWFGWQIFASSRAYTVPVVPVAEFRQSIGDAISKNEQLFERVIMVDGEDKKSLSVTGFVRTQADLQRLREIFDAGQPKIPVTFEVTVKPVTP